MKTYLINQLKKIYSYYIRRLSKTTTGDLKQEIVYLLSFPNNDHGLISSLNEDYPVTICYTTNMTLEAEEFAKEGLQIYPINSFKGLRQTVKAVTRSQIVIADNYFAFLGDIEKQKEQSFFQLWHATGAIKQFGLEDKTAKERSPEDQARFQRVYDSFDYYVVGSDKMATVFQRSYGARKEQILYLGFPRTDYLVERKVPNRLAAQLPKKIVYLPTYRSDAQLNILPDMEELSELLGNDIEIYVKAHPHVELVKNQLNERQTNINIVESDSSADDLLLIADVLITDYSSVAFDYALVNPTGKLIFYWYDEEEYKKKTGIQTEIKESFSDEICYTVKDVAKQIKTDNYELIKFNQNWNTYNDGFATQRLRHVISEKMDGI